MRIHVCSLALILSAACSDPSGTNLPPQLVIDGGTERTILVGTQQQLQARVVGGEQLEDVRWTSSDPAIARVNETGELRVATTYTACSWVTPGECQVRITAHAGDLRADQMLTIMPYEPLVELDVSHLDLEAGDSARIHVRVLLENNDVPWCNVSFASHDSAVAMVGATSGVVRGMDLGSTIIDVAVSGVLCPRDAATVSVTNRPPLYRLAIEPGVDVPLEPGASLQLRAIVTNRKDVSYQAGIVEWTTSDPSIASVMSNGVLRAGSCAATTCRATITARSGRLVATKDVTVVGS